MTFSLGCAAVWLYQTDARRLARHVSASGRGGGGQKETATSRYNSWEKKIIDTWCLRAEVMMTVMMLRGDGVMSSIVMMMLMMGFLH